MKQTIGFIIHEATNESEMVVVDDKKKRVVAETILQDADSVNRNGRCYKASDLKKEIESDRIKELIDAKEFKGEAGHPVDTEIGRQQTVLPTLACFRIDKIWMEGNLVKGLVRGTNNALGEEFDMDLREGGKKAFSLRALGSIVNESGRNYVSNLKIITYDHVIFPSHKKAYTTKLISESASFGNNVQYEETNSGLLIPITNNEVINYIKTESANLNQIFNTFDTLMESCTMRGKNQVQLVTKSGEVLIVNLENYISDEIMNYSFKM